MDEDMLWDNVNLHLEKLMKKVDKKKREWMKAAVGMVKLSKEGMVVIESGNIADIGDWEEVYTRQTIEETEVEFQDKKKWQKWKTIVPELITDLERSEDIAKEVSKKHGVKLKMVIDRDIAQFMVEIDGRGLGDDELLRRTYMNVDAMSEAWGLFNTWLYSKERLKIVKSKAH